MSCQNLNGCHLSATPRKFAVLLVALALVLLESLEFGFADSIDSGCNQAFGPILADDSPTKIYFQRLSQRGMDAPLKDFLKLWFPDRVGAPMDASIEKCISSRVRCDPKIKIDTVYSWGPIEKLNTLQKTLPDDRAWEGNPNPGHQFKALFSAVGSFGYGKIPVRIKLRADPDRVNTDIRSDFDVSDAKSIESWSFGTPEHYDEIVRDYLRFQSGKSWVGYEATYDGDRKRLFMEGLDGHEFSEPALKASLLEMIRTILRGDGRIYYSRGTCHNRSLEFQTRFPTYINPFLTQTRKGQNDNDGTRARASH